MGFWFSGGGYPALREEYEKLCPYHAPDRDHCNVWELNAPAGQAKRHPCEKPVALLRRIVRVSSRTGDLVIDPFMGSGSTGVACAEEGRRFCGCEISPRYFAAAEERINALRGAGRREDARGKIGA